MFKKKKQFGQNFLTDIKIPLRMVENSGIDGKCGVLEIGAGFGILTKVLSQKAQKVVSVEIDEELLDVLRENLRENTNVTIINDDILNVDIEALIRREFKDMPVCVCANLPYYITTPIIMKLLEGKYGFRSITVMVQKEVAARLCSHKGESEYGAVTAAISYYARVKKLFNVPRGAFSPPPNVDSAIVRFDLYESSPVTPCNETLFFKVIRAAFAARRKTLVNSLYTVFGSSCSKEKLAQAVREVTGNENIRGEQLDIYDFSLISEQINKINIS